MRAAQSRAAGRFSGFSDFGGFGGGRAASLVDLVEAALELAMRDDVTLLRGFFGAGGFQGDVRLVEVRTGGSRRVVAIQ